MPLGGVQPGVCPRAARRYAGRRGRRDGRRGGMPPGMGAMVCPLTRPSIEPINTAHATPVMLMRVLRVAGFSIAVIALWQAGVLASAYDATYEVLAEVLRPLDDLIGAT